MKVIIVGGGQVGSYLASLLLERGHEIKVIENRESRIPILQKLLPKDSVILGNGADPALLEQAGIDKTDVVAAVTGNDENNLVVGTLARLEYGVRRVVGRVNNPKNAWLFTPVMGIDVALNQADLMARLVAEEMSMGDMLPLMNLNRGEYSLVEKNVSPSSPVVGQLLKDIALPLECVLVAIMREGSMIIPRGDTSILAYDKIVAITHVSQLQTLSSLLGGEEA